MVEGVFSSWVRARGYDVSFGLGLELRTLEECAASGMASRTEGKGCHFVGL